MSDNTNITIEAITALVKAKVDKYEAESKSASNELDKIGDEYVEGNIGLKTYHRQTLKIKNALIELGRQSLREISDFVGSSATEKQN